MKTFSFKTPFSNYTCTSTSTCPKSLLLRMGSYNLQASTNITRHKLQSVLCKLIIIYKYKDYIIKNNLLKEKLRKLINNNNKIINFD